MKLGVALLILLFVAWYVYNQQQPEVKTVAYTALEQTGDACEAIAEKAAMKLPDRLPFQRLEKVARQSRVLEMCMHDRGYIENPLWQAYAKPLAQQQAETTHISYDEAYERLRREKLKTFKVDKQAPAYWVLQQQP